MKSDFQDVLECLVDTHIHIKNKLKLSTMLGQYDWKSTKERKLMKIGLRMVEESFINIPTQVNQSIINELNI